MPFRIYRWALDLRFKGVSRIRALLGLKLIDIETIVSAVAVEQISPGGWFVDVGAHHGRHVEAVLTVPEGQVVAIEGDQALAKKLKRTFSPAIRAGRLRVEGILVGAPGSNSAKFFRSHDDSGYSGLAQRALPGLDRGYEILEVQTNTLDRLLCDVAPVNCLKLDIEGAELDALRGAVAVLHRDRPLVLFECSPDAAPYFENTLHDIVAFFAELNYRVATIHGNDVTTENAGYVFSRQVCHEFCAAPAEKVSKAFSRLSILYDELLLCR